MSKEHTASNESELRLVPRLPDAEEWRGFNQIIILLSSCVYLSKSGYLSELPFPHLWNVYRWYNWTFIQNSQPGTHRKLPIPLQTLRNDRKTLTWTRNHSRGAQWQGLRPPPTHGRLGPAQEHLIYEVKNTCSYIALPRCTWEKYPEVMMDSQPLHGVPKNSPTRRIYIWGNREKEQSKKGLTSNTFKSLKEIKEGKTDIKQEQETVKQKQADIKELGVRYKEYNW